MPTIIRPRRVRRLTVEERVRELRQLMARYEYIYETTSEEMARALAAGTARDTAEVARWMVWYGELKDLTR
jgi:hypothetical protein